MLVSRLQQQGVLASLEEQVRFARRRFGHDDVIDFVAVLFGYAISGERMLEAFYERIAPWASPFHAEKVIKMIKEEGFWDGRIHNSKTNQS